MQHDISKTLSDSLRHLAASKGIKVKASHAHELAAAFFGYKSDAALRADNKFPVSNLEEVELLLPAIGWMDQRRQSLNELPELGSSIDLAKFWVGVLEEAKLFSGKAYYAESVSEYIVSDLLQEEDGIVMDQLSGVMAETNAYFGGDFPEYEPADVIDHGDQVSSKVIGEYVGDVDDERPYSGHKISFAVDITMDRVATPVGFRTPDIDAGGAVEEPDHD